MKNKYKHNATVRGRVQDDPAFEDLFTMLQSYTAVAVGKSCFPEYFTEAMVWPETYADTVTGNVVFSHLDTIVANAISGENPNTPNMNRIERNINSAIDWYAGVCDEIDRLWWPALLEEIDRP